MRFKQMEYLRWVRREVRECRKGLINLSSSGITNLDREDFPVDVSTVNWAYEDYDKVTDLESLIANRYGVKQENVLATMGVSQACFIVYSSLLEPGAEVIIEEPVYQPLLYLAKPLNVRIKFIKRRFDSGFQIDPEELKKKITKRTSLIVVTSPHNPSGIMLARDFYKEIAPTLLKNKCTLLVDEVYREFMEDGCGVPAYKFAPNIVTTNSLTKVYGLPAIRGGWIIADKRLVQRFRTVVDYISGNNSFPSYILTTEAIHRIDALKARTMRSGKENLSLVRDWINSSDKLSWVDPGGGIICFPRLKDRWSVEMLCSVLKRQYKTLIVPGAFFRARNHFRLSFWVDTSTLKKGLRNIESALNSV